MSDSLLFLYKTKNTTFYEIATKQYCFVISIFKYSQCFPRVNYSFGTVSYFSCFENHINDTPATTATTPRTYVNGMDIAPPPDLKTKFNNDVISN